MALATHLSEFAVNQSRTAGYTSPAASIDEALRSIFKPAAQETLLQKTRGIMGETLGNLPDDELEIHITKLQHLIDYWMDEYEKQLFDGKTLQQVLREG